MISCTSRHRAGVLLLSMAVLPVAEASLNTAQIVASAASQSCISWRVSGICYWLFCTKFSCKVRTSVKVSHYIPEVVVSTYTAPGGNPWREMSAVSSTAGGPENAISKGIAGLSAGGGNPAGDFWQSKEPETAGVFVKGIVRRNKDGLSGTKEVPRPVFCATGKECVLYTASGIPPAGGERGGTSFARCAIV